MSLNIGLYTCAQNSQYHLSTITSSFSDVHFGYFPFSELDKLKFSPTKDQTSDLTTFDETLVKRWLKQITIWDDHCTVELKSGLKVDVER